MDFWVISSRSQVLVSLGISKVQRCSPLPRKKTGCGRPPARRVRTRISDEVRQPRTSTRSVGDLRRNSRCVSRRLPLVELLLLNVSVQSAFHGAEETQTSLENTNSPGP